jgi:hypothetical protein
MGRDLVEGIESKEGRCGNQAVGDSKTVLP